MLLSELLSGVAGQYERDHFVAQDHRDDFDSLLVDSALAAIEKDAPLNQIEEALRSVGWLIAREEALRTGIVREATIRKLRTAGTSAPAAMRKSAGSWALAVCREE